MPAEVAEDAAEPPPAAGGTAGQETNRRSSAASVLSVGSASAILLTEREKNKYRELGITEDQLENFRKTYDMFDKDGDGSISIDELANVMRSLGQDPTQKELEDMMREVDEDGSGEIEFSEFMSMMARKVKEAGTNVSGGEDWHEAFKVFDKDGDGFISCNELQFVMSNLGETLTDEEVREMIEEVDLDRDGMVNYPEFVRVMVHGIKI